MKMIKECKHYKEILIKEKIISKKNKILMIKLEENIVIININILMIHMPDIILK